MVGEGSSEGVRDLSERVAELRSKRYPSKRKLEDRKKQRKLDKLNKKS